MTTKLKWGIMGAGLIANDCVAPAILQSNNAELFAVYSRTKDKSDSFAKRFNISNSYSNITDFLENPEMDVIYISTPNAHHYKDVLEGVKYKKHIFCEKPMSLNMDEAYEIKKNCELNHVKYGLAFMFPFHPLSVLAKEWINQNKIGHIRLIKSNFIFELPECEKINPWRFKPELSGGGSIIEVGCHCIDILNFLIEKDIQSVSSITNINRLQPPSESTGIINLKYKDDIIGIVTVSNIIPGAGPYGCNFELHGTEGSIIGLGNLSRNPSGTLIFRNKKGVEERISLPNNSDYQLYIKEVEAFSDHIINNTPLYSDVNNGIMNMKIITAAYKSAEQNRVVSLL